MCTQAKSSHAQIELWNYVARVRPEIEEALLRYLPVAPALVETQFNDALCYALFPGGKRLRPVLTLLGAEIVGGLASEVLAAAVAVEYVHTSSLIFDDLPCMDSASERRGRSSLHTRYGEGLAVLVALALMNASYGLMFDGVNAEQATRAVNAHRELVECIGARGMVAGQSIDLAESDDHKHDDFGAVATDKVSDRNEAREVVDDAVRNLKTSALIRLALRVGAILSGATDGQLAALSRYAELIGEAYQTSDDLLDLREDALLSTATTRRATFANERGAKDTKERVAHFVHEAKNVLAAEFGTTLPARLLCDMADYIAAREA